MQVGGFVCSMEGYIRQAGGGLFVWWKGSVRFGCWAFRAVEGFRSLLQRGLFCRVERFCSLWLLGLVCRVERFRSLGAFSSTEASVTANVSGALPAAPPTPPAPGHFDFLMFY